MSYKELIHAAREAGKKAYSPYSRVKVGAAIQGPNGEIITGCNVENVSYGLTICAERAAVFKAVGDGITSFQAIAVVSDTENLFFPCGACRQVLAEFSPHMKVIVANNGDKVVSTTLEELLPHAFASGDLAGGCP